MKHLKEGIKWKGRVPGSSKIRDKIWKCISIRNRIQFRTFILAVFIRACYCLYFNIPASSGLCQLLSLLFCSRTSEIEEFGLLKGSQTLWSVKAHELAEHIANLGSVRKYPRTEHKGLHFHFLVPKARKQSGREWWWLFKGVRGCSRESLFILYLN